MALLERALLVDGSFAGMLSRYGFRFEELINTDWAGIGQVISKENPALSVAPFAFIYAGYSYPRTGVLEYAGSNSWYRVSTDGNDIYYSYYFYINSAVTVAPAARTDRDRGASLRYLGN